MKLFALSLTVLSTLSFGRSPMKADIRLQAATMPFVNFHHLPAGEQKASVVSIDSRGRVIGQECIENTDTRLGVGRPVYTNCKNPVLIEKLSQGETVSLDGLIEEARLGKITFPNPFSSVCLAMPSHAYRYTADNGNVLISAGTAPCGGRTYNDSEAAKALEKTLHGYQVRYNQLKSEKFNN